MYESLTNKPWLAFYWAESIFRVDSNCGTKYIPMIVTLFNEQTIEKSLEIIKLKIHIASRILFTSS